MNFSFLTDMVGLELRKAQIRAENRFDEVFGKALLPGHYTVLVLIENNPGVTQSAIAHSAGLNRSSLVPLLKQFERKGFITRRKAGNDARSNVMEITPAGAAFIRENRPRIEALEQNLASHLGTERYVELIRSLKDLQTVL